MLRRHAALQVITLETLVGSDGQGRPSYNSPLVMNAHIVRTDEVLRTSGGEEVRSIATIWVATDEAPIMPEYNDRLQLEDGLMGIVIDRVTVKGIQTASPDHVRLKIRRE